MANLIGKTLGQYEIREKIGQGGMAQVFKAYQPGLDRFVAVKVLSPSLAEEPGFTQRFQREAHSAARLHHPHILEVYDFGLQDNYNYLVMRYVEKSRTLGDLIREGAPLDRLITYIIQVADALNYAHQQGIVHRDVKPGNILIDGKWALLTDFGLAKIREASSQLTATGIGLGTPAYMSPEQASGTGVDHRTDIYALGVILYRILTGTVPHDAPTPFAILAKRCSEPVPSLRETKPDIPESLNHVVLRSLSMIPGDRYPTATHFADALKKAEDDPGYREESITALLATESETALFDRVGDAADVTIATHGKAPLGKTTARRNSLILIAGGVLAAVIVVGALLFLLLSLRGGGGSSAAQPLDQSETPAGAQVVAPISQTEASASPSNTPSPVPPGIPSATARTDLEVRSGPGDEYGLLGYLPEGAMAEIVSRDREGKWWQIKFSLSAAGVGWIRAGSDFSEATDADNVPIAPAPPTPTPIPVPDTPTSTASSASDTLALTATPVPDTPTSTATPTRVVPTATPVTPASPTARKSPTLPAGQFALLKPASTSEPSYGMTEFEWQWTSPLGADQGFEVRVWREGEPPAGVHNAVEDNKNGKVVALGNNTYRLAVDIRDAYGVQGRSGEYLWTVVLVQISPDYKDLGIQAAPGRLRFEAGGGGGDEGGGGGGGNGGGLNP
jgi:hypothetical protein